MRIVCSRPPHTADTGNDLTVVLLAEASCCESVYLRPKDQLKRAKSRNIGLLYAK